MRSITPATGPSSPRPLSPPVRTCGLLLAILATGTSACICVIAGIERGGLPPERFAWAAVGLVLLLGAHLIPALTRGIRLSARVPALLLWFVCMASTGYGHATFFLSAQRHAGDARAAVIQGSAPTAILLNHGRSLDAISRDVARMTQALAIVRATHCETHCDALSVRRISLSAQLAALDVEASEARRREQLADRAAIAHDQLQRREDLARTDPVTARVATFLHASRESVDLFVALTFGWLLESVGCLGWMLALTADHADHAASASVTPRHSNHAASNVTPVIAGDAPEPPADAVAASNAPVTPRNAGPLTGSAPRENPVSHAPNAELLLLASAITNGRVRPTVKDIRQFMQPCSQEKAMRLRREFLELAGNSPQTHQSAADRSTSSAAASGPRLVHSAVVQSQAA
jgi:hypothetical protein